MNFKNLKPATRAAMKVAHTKVRNGTRIADRIVAGGQTQHGQALQAAALAVAPNLKSAKLTKPAKPAKPKPARRGPGQ